MMTELMLVEGVSDVQLISYYMQNVYGWKHEENNSLGIVPLDEHDHIESLTKNGAELILCGVGGNGRFKHFVEQHCVNNMIVESEISSVMVVTDRDEDSMSKIGKAINGLFKQVLFRAGKWVRNDIEDSFGQANKATVGTFFSVRNPKQAMRSFGIFISTIDWKKSESLSELFSPFLYLGKEEKY